MVTKKGKAKPRHWMFYLIGLGFFVPTLFILLFASTETPSTINGIGSICAIISIIFYVMAILDQRRHSEEADRDE